MAETSGAVVCESAGVPRLLETVCMDPGSIAGCERWQIKAGGHLVVLVHVTGEDGSEGCAAAVSGPSMNTSAVLDDGAWLTVTGEGADARRLCALLQREIDEVISARLIGEDVSTRFGHDTLTQVAAGLVGVDPARV